MAGLGSCQQLYGTQRAAATHVGMLPDCHKLGLGVADAGTRQAASATQTLTLAEPYGLVRKTLIKRNRGLTNLQLNLKGFQVLNISI